MQNSANLRKLWALQCGSFYNILAEIDQFHAKWSVCEAGRSLKSSLFCMGQVWICLELCLIFSSNLVFCVKNSISNGEIDVFQKYLSNSPNIHTNNRDPYPIWQSILCNIILHFTPKKNIESALQQCEYLRQQILFPVLMQDKDVRYQPQYLECKETFLFWSGSLQELARCQILQ